MSFYLLLTFNIFIGFALWMGELTIKSWNYWFVFLCVLGVYGCGLYDGERK